MSANVPFGRPEIYIFGSSEASSIALCNVCSLLVSGGLPHRISHPDEWPNRTRKGLIDLNGNRAEDICSVLDDVPPSRLCNSVAIVDFSSDSSVILQSESAPPTKGAEPDVDSTGRGFKMAELCLNFPEVHFIFILNHVPKNSDLHRIHKHHVFDLSFEGVTGIADSLCRHGQGFRSWYDPTGFRTFLRNGRLPERFAAAVDEETSYLRLNGYLLYRRGYPVYLAPTFAEMDAVLQPAQLGCSPLVIEDVELQFGDAVPAHNEFLSLEPSNDAEAVLKARQTHYGAVLSSASRIIVSVSPRTGGDYLAWLMKPYGGIFASELSDDRVPLVGQAADSSISSQTTTGQSRLRPGAGHHSAPHRRQHIAERLLTRARDYTAATNSVDKALHVALLAAEARQLLADKTIVLSLEALSLQHQMEAKAECVFAGGTYSLNAERRFTDLETAVDKLYPPGPFKNYQKMNALIEVSDRLATIYGEFSQFKDQEEAAQRLRGYRNRLKNFVRWPAKGIGGGASEFRRRAIGLVSGSIESYFNLLMSGVKWIGLACCIWIAVFAFAYVSLVECRGPDKHATCVPVPAASSAFSDRYQVWFMHSAVTFIALQQGILGDPKLDESAQANRSTTQPVERKDFAVNFTPAGYIRFWLITMLEMICGILHVGIFVAFLFQKISR